ncbi:hypothetical protein ACOBR2_14835 [Telmatobacter bradus]|uniref:hypothetical protein n=1 Tax=Telmatobacter bradus TaxID=474953 RepID=UPI003B430D99
MTEGQSETQKNLRAEASQAVRRSFQSSRVLQNGKCKIAVAQLRGNTTSDGLKMAHIITLA